MFLGARAFIPGQQLPTKQIQPFSQVYECQYSQCQATAKSTGNRCKHCVSNRDDKYCWQHK